jgi:hypothetical protein
MRGKIKNYKRDVPEGGFAYLYKYLFLLVPGAGIEPARHYVPRDFKSLASTCSATRAAMENRTR